jgi:Sec-independent protein translocase protein TatA
MDILGIGPLEIIFVLIIALIVFGPKDMVKAGRTIGRFLRTLVTSETWMVIQQASKDIRNIPNHLMREAGLEDIQNEIPTAQSIRKELDLENIEKEIKGSVKDISDWTTPPPSIAPPMTSTPDAQSASKSPISSSTEQKVEPSNAIVENQESHTPEMDDSTPKNQQEKSAKTVVSQSNSSNQEEPNNILRSTDEPESPS